MLLVSVVIGVPVQIVAPLAGDLLTAALVTAAGAFLVWPLFAFVFRHKGFPRAGQPVQGGAGLALALVVIMFIFVGGMKAERWLADVLAASLQLDEDAVRQEYRRRMEYRRESDCFKLLYKYSWDTDLRSRCEEFRNRRLARERQSGEQ
jgi:hypothetical protein